MKVEKVLNDYILVRVIPEELPKKSAIYIPGNTDSFQRGVVMMLSDDITIPGLKLGEIVAFYNGSGIKAGEEEFIVHIQNIIGKI